MHLPALIDSIHQVRSDLIEPYLDHNRNEICADCQFLHTAICPCPMDYLLPLIVEAVERVDRRSPKRSADQAEPKSPRFGTDKTAVEAIRDAYAAAADTWSGCDWPTDFGKTGLNLKDRSSADAKEMAELAQDSDEKADWNAAADWLARVEWYAQQANEQGAHAMAAAQQGDWAKAFEHARRAWALEFATGRAIWNGFPLAWQGLHEVAEAAFRRECE